MPQKDWTYGVQEVNKLDEKSRQVYLDNWETKTRFAEHDTKWNADIQHRVHQAIEKLSTLLMHTNRALAESLTRIETLEAELKTMKNQN